MFSGLVCPSCGAMKTRTVMIAKGMAARFMKGKRRPFGFRLRSERDAIHGSVTASKMRQTNEIRPSTVSTQKMWPVGRKYFAPSGCNARSVGR